MKRYILIGVVVATVFLIPDVADAQLKSVLPDAVGVTCSNQDGSNLGECLKEIYIFGVSGVGILAVIVMMWGGFMWLTSGGNVSRIESAKEWIYGSVLGLVIALASFLILNTINPQLTVIKLNITKVENPDDLIEDTVCCLVTDTTTNDDQFIAGPTILLGGACGALNTYDDLGAPIRIAAKTNCPDPGLGELNDPCVTDADCNQQCIDNDTAFLAPSVRFSRLRCQDYKCIQKSGPTCAQAL